MNTTKKIRVLVVEDSFTVRKLLEHTINSDPRLEIVASVESAELAFDEIQRVRPDVISMDIHLPGVNGLEATRRIMTECPTPIVVVSVSTTLRDAEFTMEALKTGALSVVEKPVNGSSTECLAMARRLCNQLASMSQVSVIRQRPALQEPRTFARVYSNMPSRHDTSAPTVTADSIVGIVASTGGPRAISTIFSALGPDFPLPILFVQHMTPAFVETFVTWLDRTTPVAVRLAEDGENPLPGHAYHAPEGRHLEYALGRLRVCGERGPVGGHRPSGNVLLSSLARETGPRAIGVVLTGMGTDGAAGLGEMYRAGAHTIAESETTAVVNGMPAAATALGAAREVLPVHDIGEWLRSLAARVAKVTS